MAEQTEKAPRPRPSRGTGFPSMALDDAAGVIKNAGKYGKSHPDAAFAGYMGHDSTNSGPFRAKMASLRDWGLIERPKDGQVPLTELGQHLAHPDSPEAERGLLQDAFFNAKPFAAIYEESAKETDLSLQFLGNRAVTALGVSAQNKSRFAESFRRSVLAAGLGQEGSKGSIRLIPPGSAGEEGHTEETDADTGTSTAGRVEHADTERRPPRRRSVEATPVLHQEWEVAGGRVLFEVELDRALPGTAFAGVAAVITAVEKFVGSLEPPTPPAGSDGAAD